MTESGVSDIVISTCGRDKDRIFLVIKADDEYLYLADGKMRHIEKPKQKKRKHTAFFAHGEGRVAEKLLSGERLQNSEIRKMLANLKKEQA